MNKNLLLMFAVLVSGVSSVSLKALPSPTPTVAQSVVALDRDLASVISSMASIKAKGGAKAIIKALDKDSLKTLNTLAADLNTLQVDITSAIKSLPAPK